MTEPEPSRRFRARWHEESGFTGQQITFAFHRVARIPIDTPPLKHRHKPPNRLGGAGSPEEAGVQRLLLDGELDLVQTEPADGRAIALGELEADGRDTAQIQARPASQEVRKA